MRLKRQKEQAKTEHEPSICSLCVHVRSQPRCGTLDRDGHRGRGGRPQERATVGERHEAEARPSSSRHFSHVLSFARLFGAMYTIAANARYVFSFARVLMREHLTIGFLQGVDALRSHIERNGGARISRSQLQGAGGVAQQLAVLVSVDPEPHRSCTFGRCRLKSTPRAPKSAM